jgi:hypothetical protein
MNEFKIGDFALYSDKLGYTAKVVVIEYIDDNYVSFYNLEDESDYDVVSLSTFLECATLY